MQKHTLGVWAPATHSRNVQELARILTGAEVNASANAPTPEENGSPLYRRGGAPEFNPARHDPGARKRFLGTAFNNQEQRDRDVNRASLNDEEEAGWWARLWDSFQLLKNPDKGITKEFYEHPEIKYLGSSGIFRNPSSFKAVSFSKTLFNLLFGDEQLTREKIDARLKEVIRLAEGADKILDTQTARYINSLWMEAYGDITKFKLQLETWFDRTMEQATEWYKRKIQIILLILGFLIAWCFNADTFTIVNKLSRDKDARDKIVSMANAYVQNNKIQLDTTAIKSATELQTYTDKLDSLLVIKQQIETEIGETSTLLGIGAWPADIVKVHTDPRSGQQLYTPQIDREALTRARAAIKEGEIKFTLKEKIGYFFTLPYVHFWGFLLRPLPYRSALRSGLICSISLAQLRTSIKQKPASPNNSVDNTVSPLNREG